MEIDKRFKFSGHAIGAAAHFHRLDELENLNHVIPTLGQSAVPVVGGHSHHEVQHKCFSVDQPRKRTLLALEHAEASSTGRYIDEKRFETTISALVRSVDILEKLHVQTVELHQTSSSEWDAPQSSITTSGCKIEGLRLGNVAVQVELDEEPFATCGTRRELNAYYGARSESWRRENSWRFHTLADAGSIQEYGGRYFGTLVKKIDLSGPPEELKTMHVDGYSIKWDGFGKIFLGEVIVRDIDRHVTMIRLKMGSDAAGFATVGDGHTNSSTVP